MTGVDKPWPRLVARLRAAGIHPNITQVAVETALLREAADALDIAAMNREEGNEEFNIVLARAEAAEARAEEAIQWIGVVRDELVIAGFPGGDRDVALANIRTLATGRRVIAENAAVLERLGTSGDQTVSEQAIAAEATRLAQSRNLMHKSESPDKPQAIDRMDIKVDGVQLRDLPVPDSADQTYTVIHSLYEHDCPMRCDSPYAVNCNCQGKCHLHKRTDRTFSNREEGK